MAVAVDMFAAMGTDTAAEIVAADTYHHCLPTDID